MNNVEIVAQAYKAFGKGDIPGVLELFDSEIIWDECHGFPHIEGEGIFIGPQAIVEGVFASIPEHVDDFSVDVRELFGTDDKVVMVGYYNGKWKETGKPFHANATHVYWLKDHKVVKFFQAVDTAEIVNP